MISFRLVRKSWGWVLRWAAFVSLCAGESGGSVRDKRQEKRTAGHDFATTPVQMQAFSSFFMSIYLGVRWCGRYGRSYGIDRRFVFAGIVCCAAGNRAALG